MAQDNAASRAPRNIVVCCDGTGNQFGVHNTNIAKLCEVLDRGSDDQVVYYDPGVGTLGDQRALTRIKKWFTRALGGAIGLGIRDKVQEAYDFLAWHYRPGDRVFLFGFSRGAYTVRALASLIHMYGLTGPGCGNLSPYLLNMQSDESHKADGRRWQIARRFKATFGRPVQIEFLGAFDTVSSVGWFWNPLKLPYTKTNPSVLRVRHAVSIDERRAFFRTNLFTAAAGQDFKEVWFPGVHSDVGGGYDDAEQGLAQVAFAWMAREAAEHGLHLDPQGLAQALAGGTYARPDPLATPHESLDWRWAVLEVLPKLERRCHTDAAGQQQWRWRVWPNFGHRRTFPDQAVIHRSVLLRHQKAGYLPGIALEQHPVEDTRPWQPERFDFTVGFAQPRPGQGAA